VIIDCHVHLNHYEDSPPPPLEMRVERLLAAMAEARTDYALVLTSYTVNADRPSTAEVILATEGHPQLGVVAGVSYLQYRERDLRELADLLDAGLVKGLKLYPGYEPFYPHDQRLEVIYDLAAEFRVPVMIHSGDTYSPKGKLKYAHPLEVDEVAVDHPDVNFVICHLGNPWLVDCMEVVYKNKNVFADFSGLVLGEITDRFEDYMSGQLEDVLTYAGEPDQFLFGTDWPICDMKSYVDFVEQLDLAEEDRHAILYENTRRLFRLPLPPRPELLAAP
jgi:hypothetical protein